MRESVSSFLTAHQHMLGYLVPYNGVEDVIKERRYNQGYSWQVMQFSSYCTIKTTDTF